MTKTISVRFNNEHYEKFKEIAKKFNWDNNSTMKYIFEIYLDHEKNCGKASKSQIKEIVNLLDERLRQIR